MAIPRSAVRIHPKALTAVILVIALIAVVIVSTASSASAAGETCDTFLFTNNLDEPVKLKRVEDGVEVTKGQIQPGATAVADTLAQEDAWLVRKPSDRSRLFTKPAGSCVGEGTTIVFGDAVEPLLTCTASLAADGSSLSVQTNISNPIDGLRVAYNLERGDRTGENFVFLGSELAGARTTFAVERDIADVAEGEWQVKARLRLADGSRQARVDCGSIDTGGDILDQVDGSQPLSTLPTSCWAVNRVVGGEPVADLTLLSPRDTSSLNLRSDNQWVGRFAELADPTATKVIIRGGERAGTYPCARGWTGDVVLKSEDTHDRIDIDVLAAATAPDGSTRVLWQQTGRLLEGGGNGGAASTTVYLTNLANGSAETVISDVIGANAIVVDCEQRFVAVSIGDQGGPGLIVVDLFSGQWAGAGSSTPAGFDCTGTFYSTDFGDLDTLDLDRAFNN